MEQERQSMKFIIVGITLALSMGSSVLLADYKPSLPGKDATTWQRPDPIARNIFWHESTAASQTTAAAVRMIKGQTEGQAYIAHLPKDQQDTLLKETVVLYGEDQEQKEEKGIKGYIRAVVIFDQNVETCMELMFEPVRESDYLAELDDTETVTRVDNVGELTKFTIEFLWWDIDFWLQHWFYPEEQRFEWYLDEKNFENDIGGNKGFWQLYALNDTQTVGEYGVYIDTGFPIPRRMFERIQRRQIPEAMRQFQRFINSNGTYKKD